MISKTNALLMEPVVYHERLHTSFTGSVHPISTPEAPVHQYLGIKYATLPARFRQSRLCTTYAVATDATQYGFVNPYALLIASADALTLRPICPQPGCKGYEEELFNLPAGSAPPQTLMHDELECLNLNITCPGTVAPGVLHPVMVFIHGYAPSIDVT